MAYGTRGGLATLDRGIRKIARTFGRTATLTHSEKAAATFVVESNAERLASQLLELEPNARSHAAQPFTIDLIDGALLKTAGEVAAARSRHTARGKQPWFYTPDFSVRWSIGGMSCVEVKLEGHTGDDAYASKLERARQVLGNHGIDFRVMVIPRYWCHPLRVNLPLLHQASKRKDLAPDDNVLAEVERLAASGATTLRDYCPAFGMDMRMAPVMVAFGVLDVDVCNEHFNFDTPARPAYGSLDHLSLLSRIAP